MKIEVKRWKDISIKDRALIFKRSEQNIEDVIPVVKEIIQNVKDNGDKAILHYNEKFIGIPATTNYLKVTNEEFISAETELKSDVKEAIRFSINNIKRFHEAQKPEAMNMMEVSPGVFAGERATPIDSVGLYVPGGRGTFPSMLYMLAVPATIAGVKRICVTTPPNNKGTADKGVLYACKLLGINEVYKIGGAEAITALTYGTETIKPVVKISGPGSMYVTAAKRLLYSAVDVGLPAGPSESALIADNSADPYNMALDLLVEAEHGSDSSAILLTNSLENAEKSAKYMEEMIENLPEPRKTFVTDVLNGYGGVIVTETIDEACDISNQYAPEHLSLHTKDPWDTISKITNAGEIILGDSTPFSAANYSVGPNAVLPTGGKAKTYSAVGVRDFIKYSSVIYSTQNGYKNMKPHVIALADYEGFTTHGDAFKKRK
ncbi:MAG: histidinol dehydrogenase [Spirochaetaceae bacterium 4572_7]|nr:MAG: histidinol dehydrogenase [Spirochaetaceae bacterium 4572_7]